MARVNTAMVLAAGRGERLRPLTDTLPKPLLEVAGRPLIEHHLVRLAALGIERAVVNLHHLGDRIRARLGDGSRFGLEIRYSEEAALLETGGGLRHALPALGSAPFVLVNGDVYTDYPLERLLTPPAREIDAHLVLVPHPPWRDHGDFDLGGAPAAGDRASRPLIRAERPRLVYAGLALLRPRLIRPCAPGWRPLRPVLEAAAGAGRASGERFDGEWEDVGTRARLDALRARVARG